MAFYMKQIVGEITVNWDIFKEINLKSVYNLHLYTNIVHVNCSREPHVTPDFFKFHTVSNKKYY